MPSQLESYLYERNGRWWADLRDYDDVGGGRESLRRPGKSWATKDRDIALELLAARVEDLERLRRAKLMGAMHGIRPAEFQAYAAHHLRRKAAAGQVTEKTLATAEHHLARAVEFFGATTYLHAITVADVTRWSESLSGASNGRSGVLSGGSVRHYLNDLSNLFRRAQGEGRVQPGYNPVGAMMDKPNAARREAAWLEVHDAALVFEAARTWRPERPDKATPYAHPIIGTFLLTGGRMSEVLGLLVDDISFDRGTVTFRPHPHRRLKSKTSHRSVPLFPQLREILQAHVFERGHVSGLLFPSHIRPGVITDLRATLDAVGKRAGFEVGEVRTKKFRHTFCSAALQLLDRGAPISPWTVSRWMGHGGRSLVDRIYGHLGDVRHRSEVVEYRVEQYREQLGERLSALEATA